MTESFLVVNGQCTFLDNFANVSGAAISAYKSSLKFSGDTTIQGNVANKNGGGIFLVRSALESRSNFLSFYDNTAAKGGAIYFDQVSTLYIVKENLECEEEEWYCMSNPNEWLQLTFSGNSAYTKGGALYVNDDHADSCHSKPYESDNVCNECFMQTVADYVSCNDSNVRAKYANINFTNNSAPEGSVLYGGLLDRCAVDKFAEHRQLTGYIMHPLAYFKSLCLTSLSDNDLASGPLRICFCDNSSIDCSKPPPEYTIERGGVISVELTVVDQMNKSMDGSVFAYLSSESSRLGESQSIQDTGYCTELTFNVYSAAASETLSLYANGSCNNTGISRADIAIDFVPDCPPGFALSDSSLECVCDQELRNIVIECFIENGTLVRRGSAWISVWNASDLNNIDDDCSNASNSTCMNSGIYLHPYCPYDYCHPPTENVIINLNSGSNDQCAFNRSGSLCGCCDTEANFSLTLGSSRCEQCKNSSLFLIIPFALAGIGLVVLMMVCNLTVAAGTLNGLLFYTNILIANRSTFFPFQQSFFTVFVSWLGLNLGIATCFYDGMDAFAKVWIQISFEAYLIVLMFVIIMLGRNVKVSTFFHRHNLHQHWPLLSCFPMKSSVARSFR